MLRKHGTGTDANGAVQHSNGITDPIDPAGSPTWIEYDLLGQHRNIGSDTKHTQGNAQEALDDESAQEMAVGEYNQLATPLLQARQQPGSQVLTVEQYYAAQCRLDGRLINATDFHGLEPSTRSVIVNASAESCATFFRVESPLVGAAVPVRTDQACEGGPVSVASPPCRTVLVSQDTGKLLYATAFVIGYESAFLAFDSTDGNIPTNCLPGGVSNDAVVPDSQFVLDDQLYADALKARANGTPMPAGISSDVLNMNLAEAIAFNDCRNMTPNQHLRVPSPIAGVFVELADTHIYHTDRTNIAGAYGIFYPTPEEFFDFNVNATLAFSAFNPRVPSSKYYYLTGGGVQSAVQDPVLTLPVTQGGADLVGLLATAGLTTTTTVLTAGSTPHTQTNFPVDAAMLAVAAYVTNKDVVQSPDPNSLQLVSVPQSVGGKYSLELAYSTSPQTGIGGHVQHRGLLSSISIPDLRDSEVYVFRQGDGYLIGSRWGLLDREVLNADAETPGCSDKACMLAVALIRGGAAGFTGVTEQKYNAGVNIAPVVSRGGTVLKPGRFGIELDYGRNVNGPYRPQLRPGDRVKIVVVNRATGYIGTALADYKSDSRGMSSFQAVGEATQCGPIRQSSGAPCVIMRPPNLRVRAVRTTVVEQGANKGQEKQYVIGFEGSGLDTDKTITIETEWVDADGTPLPDGLPGFTGRLAKVVGGSQVPESERVVVKAPNDAGVEEVGLEGDQAAHFAAGSGAAGSGGTGGGGSGGTSGHGSSGGHGGVGGALLTGIDPALLAQCFSGNGNPPAFCSDLTPLTGGETLTGLFPIRPGKNTSIIKLPQRDADRSHLYVHVDAQPMERNIDFLGRPEPAKPSFSVRNVCFSTCVDPNDPSSDRCSQTGVDVTDVGAGWSCVERPLPGSYKSDGAVSDAAAPYLQRPSSYVPFLVPHFIGMVPPNSAAGVPQYEWEYRPEMQFSLFDLKVSEIKATGADGTTTDFANASGQLPRDTQDLAIKYALKEPNVGDLDRFEGERDLVFSLGCIDQPDTPPDRKCGVAKTAKITNDGTATVDLNATDLAAAFKADDLLTLRLVQNGDAGNVLWENAFVDLAVYLTRNEQNVANIQIGAETPTQAHAVVQPGTADLSGVLWSIVDKSKGVIATLEPAAGPTTRITAPEGSAEGTIDLEAAMPNGGPKTRVRIPVGCDCKTCNTPGQCIQRVGSVDMTFSLGRKEGGLSAGSLILKIETLNEDSNKRRLLQVSDEDEGMLILRDSGGLRQVVAAETFVQIDDIQGGNGYELRFYERRVANLGIVDPATGLFHVDYPDPADHDLNAFAVWRIEGEGLAAGSSKKLRTTETRDGVARVSEYEQDSAGNWTLNQGEGLRVEKREDVPQDVRHRLVRTTISGPTGITSVIEQTYEIKDWGEELVKEVRDPGGFNLTTTTAYYENPHDAGSYKKIRYRTNPDGSWVAYAYDTQGRLAAEMRPWLDEPSSALGASTTSGHVTRYSYDPLSGVDALLTQTSPDQQRKDTPRTISERINGVEVALTYLVVERRADGGRTETEARCAKPGISFSSGDCLRTVTTYSGLDLQASTGGQVVKVEHPDGRLERYSYEHGTWDGTTFAAITDGHAVRTTVIEGTTEHPEGIPFKSIRTVTVVDERGNSVLSERYAFVPSGQELVAWTRSNYDPRGHLERTEQSTGELETATWGCCDQDETVDSRGIRTTVTGRDGLNRIKDSSRAGILTHYEYDAEGRRLEVTRAGEGGLSLTSLESYDAAGRVESSTSEDNLLTEYRYENSGLRVVATRPGGSTEVLERYSDGQQKSVTGTAVVARYFTYAVNGDGSRTTETRIGNADSPAFTRTIVDMLGRTVRVERPGYGGTLESDETVYNGKGQVARTTATGTADTLYTYDEAGQQFRTALDVNANQTVDLAGPDRVTETSTQFVQIGADWWNETTQGLYATDESSAVVDAGSSRTRLTGLGVGGVIAERVAIDVDGNITRQTIAVNRDSATELRRTSNPESHIDAVDLSVDGRLQERRTATGNTTEYRYDGLGRSTEVIDPRLGSTVTTYDAATGRRIGTTDPAGSSVTFAYDPLTGRRTRECNAHGKCSYVSYDERGAPSRIWGDVPYPVEYVYDDMGRRVEMHTFREELAWASTAWPDGSSVASDTTTWTYEPATGLLLNKSDAADHSVTYSYEQAGRVKSRTWARQRQGGGPLTTTYDYDASTGELLGVDYNDATPDVGYSYDRLGRQKLISDGTGVRTLTYNVDDLQLESEVVAGPMPAAITPRYANTGLIGRPIGFSLDGDHQVTYEYDSIGRLAGTHWNAGGRQDSATYTYLASSDLVAGYQLASGLGTGYAYEPHRNLKTYVTNRWHAGGSASSMPSAVDPDPPDNVWSTISRYQYDYDAIGRHRYGRISGRAFTGDAFNKWTYDDRNELTASSRFLGSDLGDESQPVAQLDRRYSFDPIGNRRTSDSSGIHSTYVTNAANEYESVDARSLSYDDDGNLVDDGSYRFAYNGENQLVSVEPSNPVEGNKRLGFSYDYMGRRVRKVAEVWSAGTWAVAETTDWLYSGWNKVLERSSAPAQSDRVRFFVWGADVSSSLDANGIGGLLAVVDQDGLEHLPTYDGNGNVSELVDTTGSVEDHYEYDPFGVVTASYGPGLGGSTVGFSTKDRDEEAGLDYFGYRYYEPTLGRWTQRDPLVQRDPPVHGELYGQVVRAEQTPNVFVGNNAVDNVDPFGLLEYTASQGVNALEGARPRLKKICDNSHCLTQEASAMSMVPRTVREKGACDQAKCRAEADTITDGVKRAWVAHYGWGTNNGTDAVAGYLCWDWQKWYMANLSGSAFEYLVPTPQAGKAPSGPGMRPNVVHYWIQVQGAYCDQASGCALGLDDGWWGFVFDLPQRQEAEQYTPIPIGSPRYTVRCQSGRFCAYTQWGKPIEHMTRH